VNPSKVLTRPVSWDGLSLSTPGDWEPARLGRGYLLLEDGSGPRLELRWQRLKGGFSPDKALKRLARKKQLRPARPGPAGQAVLEALPASWRALPCAVAGRGAEALMLAIPGGPAVVAGFYPRPGESPDLWPSLVASLAGQPPGKLALFDIRAEIPKGFSLGGFSFKLGLYRVEFKRSGVTLELYRLAPAEVILRDQALAGWARGFFALVAGRDRAWEQGLFAGLPAARLMESKAPGAAGLVRALAARVAAKARWTMAVAWLADKSRILAVSARHTGAFSSEEFEDICTGYVLEQIP
jgi:hypothetical protein